MTSIRIASISRMDLEGHEETAPSITDVKHLSSYNWMESVTPTIAIPGCPPLWPPPKVQNAARHPESPLEPLFRVLYTTHPSFDIGAVDLVTIRNNIRVLLSFINPSLSKYRLEPFTIEFEITGKTAVFCRAETETVKNIRLGAVAGFGHEFEKAYTRNQVDRSTGHHRIINYSFDGLRLIVCYETEAN
ncbi:hypothetical protein M747DRAFT_317254 [Aspergillus niger ATCC 13496]|uniref:Contig An04c0250, genomic contig n=3 Tax=Aspergillus niger TaxID=5061 RepID=A2QJR4_ASPNC|nr:uncharacterized protein An04g07980 [Aspergillus niger]RDH17173.1 hypothetical protein M747DRAFT_317254 [Aspergillus niger ATCC 13496]CAK47955.1 unnamed protein product [Aspergillus niger]